jgi:predicted transcriptional regulator
MTADRKEMKVTIAKLQGDSVLVSANHPALLAAQVLRHQREIHGLSLADVAKKLGASSVNAYAAYEHGRREPSLSKYRELLAVVAPEMELTVTPVRVSESMRRHR